jgi:hypothetical protein
MSKPVYELDRYIDTIQCKNTGTVHIETGGIDHHETGVPTQVELEWSRNGVVHISVQKSVPGDGTEVSATVYLTVSDCEALADALRDDSMVQFTTDHASTWIRKGWLYNDGYTSDDDGVVGELEYAKGSLSITTIKKEGVEGLVSASTCLTADEAEWLADSLEAEAEIARENEVATSSDTDSKQSEPRIPKKWKQVGATLGVTGVASFVAVRVMNEVATSITINGEQLPQTDPFAVVWILMILFVVVKTASGKLPRKMGVGRRP